MANYFVTNPIDVVKVGQQVKVKVIDIDLEREKVSLSMKDESGTRDQGQGTRTSNEKKAEYTKKDDTIGESTMKGNITFS